MRRENERDRGGRKEGEGHWGGRERLTNQLDGEEGKWEKERRERRYRGREHTHLIMRSNVTLVFVSSFHVYGGGRGGDARAQGHLMGCANSDARIHDQELEEEHEMEGNGWQRVLLLPSQNQAMSTRSSS